MKQIAIGCGIAALIIIGIGVGAGIFGVRWVKQQMADTQRLERMMEKMESAYGKPEEFQPPTDGIYPTDRVRLFAQMRGELLNAGEEFRFKVQDMALGGKKGWLRGFRSVVDLLNGGAGYLATADSLLLAAGMSHGEYAHYQTLLLHGFLGESPAAFIDENPPPEADSSFSKAFSDIVRQYMADARGMMRNHARNARDGAEGREPECAEWIDYLDIQLEESRSSHDRIAMTGPLAPSLAEAFADRRFEFEATRPSDYGSWLLSILMVVEFDDDGNGFKLEIGI